MVIRLGWIVEGGGVCARIDWMEMALLDKGNDLSCATKLMPNTIGEL